MDIRFLRFISINYAWSQQADSIALTRKRSPRRAAGGFADDHDERHGGRRGSGHRGVRRSRRFYGRSRANPSAQKIVITATASIL